MNSIQVPLTFSEHHSRHYHLQPKVSDPSLANLPSLSASLKHIEDPIVIPKDITRLFKMQFDSQYLLDSNSL